VKQSARETSTSRSPVNSATTNDLGLYLRWMEMGGFTRKEASWRPVRTEAGWRLTGYNRGRSGGGTQVVMRLYIPKVGCFELESGLAHNDILGALTSDMHGTFQLELFPSRWIPEDEMDRTFKVLDTDSALDLTFESTASGDRLAVEEVRPAGQFKTIVANDTLVGISSTGTVFGVKIPFSTQKASTRQDMLKLIDQQKLSGRRKGNVLTYEFLRGPSLATSSTEKIEAAISRTFEMPCCQGFKLLGFTSELLEFKEAVKDAEDHEDKQFESMGVLNFRITDNTGAAHTMVFWGRLADPSEAIRLS